MEIANFFYDLFHPSRGDHMSRLLEVIVTCIIVITVIQVAKFVKDDKNK